MKNIIISKKNKTSKSKSKSNSNSNSKSKSNSNGNMDTDRTYIDIHIAESPSKKSTSDGTLASLLEAHHNLPTRPRRLQRELRENPFTRSCAQISAAAGSAAARLWVYPNDVAAANILFREVNRHKKSNSASNFGQDLFSIINLPPLLRRHPRSFLIQSLNVLNL